MTERTEPENHFQRTPEPSFHHTHDKSIHLSTDTGGTFTDFVYLDEKGLHTFKELSTPSNPVNGIASGLTGFHDLHSFSHGTTVATNAVLERKGDRTALVTTKGFRDILAIARQKRSHLYSMKTMRPDPLIDRHDIFEVDERVGPDGRVLRAIDKDELLHLADVIGGRGYQSIAVSYLFSFLYPEHEILTGHILSETGLNVSLSSTVLPEYREYERTSSTVIDAFVKGKLNLYMNDLGKLLERYRIEKYYIMESEGGVAPAEEVMRVPSKGLLSGPAGGVSGALYLAEKIGMNDLITFDMGGTSTDISRITDLRPEYTTGTMISGLPISRKCINIVTIGAGGGSIARLDMGNAITVGPESSGANPGPVCYDLGGEEITVTDTNLLAGYINPDDFLGKGRDLNVTRTHEIMESLARKLDYDMEETIQGILKVVNHNMASALRMVTTEVGKDPARHTLFSFGGAGPLHAVELARELGMERVLIPFAAGMFSAFGILISDVVHSYSVTRVMILNSAAIPVVEEIINGFIEDGREKILDDGIPPDQIQFLPTLDLRYHGQSYSLNLPIDLLMKSDVARSQENSVTPSDIAARIRKDFESMYHERFGYLIPGEIEIVNIRLETRGRRPVPDLAEKESNGINEYYTKRDCLFGEWMEVPVFRRSDLDPGFTSETTAIIEDNGSTIVLPPGTKWKVDRFGNLEVRV